MCFITILLKEIKLILRDTASLILLFALPATFILILSISLQGVFSTSSKEKMDIIVINEDKNEFGKKMINGLRESGNFKIQLHKNKKFLNEALKSLEKNGVRIVVYIPENASESAVFEDDARIELYFDPALSNEFVSSFESNIRASASQISLELLKNKFEQMQKKISLHTGAESVINNTKDENKKLQKSISGSNGISILSKFVTGNGGQNDSLPNSVQQTVPGWTLFAIFWITQILSMNLVMERKTGAFKRILVSPMGRYKYFWAKIIPYFTINIIQAIFMFLIGIYILPLLGSDSLEINNIPAIGLITIFFSLCSLGIGFLIASISKTVMMSAIISATCSIMLAAISGIMVPRFIMPNYLQNIAFLTPHGWALEGYLDILVRGKGLREILNNLIVIFIFAVISYIPALLRFNKSEGME